LGDDTAHEVFQKVTVAAEITLARALPQLIAGTAARVPMDLKSGSYFSGRKPEDGRIDWSQPAQAVYNLVRAVAPPYPGAFADIDGARVIVNKAKVSLARTSTPVGSVQRAGHTLGFCCGDGNLLVPLSLTVNNERLVGTTLKKWLTARAQV
jgi:methionyl-tRNA formyltransferase